MRAILLAAGQGSRLLPHTATRPKCLVELAGRPLLDYQLDAFRSVGLDDITIVTGYRGEMVDHLAGLRGHSTRHNHRYADTNMVTSLMCAADLLEGSDDVVVSYADLVFEPWVLERLVASPHRLSTVVDLRWLELFTARFGDPLLDAETLRFDDSGIITDIGQRPTSVEAIQGQYIGITKFSADGARQAVESYRRLVAERGPDRPAPTQMYMTTFLRRLSSEGLPLHSVPIKGGWLEVDTVEDLALYQRLHRQGELDGFCRLDMLAACGAEETGK